jgi:hypothetical protein
MHKEIATRLSSMKKKPVVLASNRGHYSSKNRRVEEWCLSLTPLEPFFKDSSLVALRFRVSPPPSPHGEGQRLQIVLCSQWDCRYFEFRAIPDFGRFYGSRGSVIC